MCKPGRLSAPAGDMSSGQPVAADPPVFSGGSVDAWAAWTCNLGGLDNVRPWPCAPGREVDEVDVVLLVVEVEDDELV